MTEDVFVAEELNAKYSWYSFICVLSESFTRGLMASKGIHRLSLKLRCSRQHVQQLFKFIGQDDEHWGRMMSKLY